MEMYREKQKRTLPADPEVMTGTSVKDSSIKKQFKRSVHTITKALTKTPVKDGYTREYLVLVRDTLHSEKSKPPAPFAQKIICYGEGKIMEDFVSTGIKYDERNCFFFGRSQ